MESAPTLAVRDPSYSLPGRKLLERLNLSISAGEWVAIMGPRPPVRCAACARRWCFCRPARWHS